MLEQIGSLQRYLLGLRLYGKYQSATMIPKSDYVANGIRLHIDTGCPLCGPHNITITSFVRINFVPGAWIPIGTSVTTYRDPL